MRASIILIVAGLFLAIAPACGDELVFHKVVLQVSPNAASGEVAGEGEFPEGKVRKVYAFPNYGYRFVNWTKTADATEVSTDEIYEFTLSSAVDFTANFSAVPYYTIMVFTNTTGGGSGGELSKSENTAFAGRPIVLQAYKAAGYNFVNWTDNDAANAVLTNGPTLRFTMPARNVNYRANFAKIPAYTVAVFANDTNKGTVIGSPEEFTVGREVTIQAYPKSGYQFIRWEETATSNSVTNASSYTFPMPAQNLSFTAIFDEVTTYNITPVVQTGQSDRGSVSGGGVMPENFPGSVEAFPKFGFNFEKWTIGGTTVGTAAKHDYVATNHMTFTAHFLPKPTYTVTLSTNNPAACQTLIGPEAPVMADTPTIIQAYPKPGYQFDMWIDKNDSDTPVSTSAVYQFTMPNAAVHYQAVFSARSSHTLTTTAYDLTSATESGGSFFGGNTDYQAGSLVVITAVPNIGYRFLRWRKDNPTSGDIVSTEQTYVLTMPDFALSYYAVFEKVPYTVTLKAIGGGNITVGGVTYTNNHQLTKYYNDKFTLVSAASNASFFFTQWRFQMEGFDGTATPDPYPYTMPNADVTLTANYELRFPNGGSGTIGDPFLIGSGFQLNRIRETLINGNYYFKLIGNIDLSVIDLWEPIGSLSKPFMGTIWGQGYTISGMNIDRSIDIDNGLIGYMTVGGLYDITMTGATVVGANQTAILVGRISAGASTVTVSNCHTAGTVSGDANVGGLVGSIFGNFGSALKAQIVKSSSSATVSGIDSVGGLVGYFGSQKTTGSTEIVRSFATGNVTGTGATASTGVGGLVGTVFIHVSQGGTLRIQNSYATGAVSGASVQGGLLGFNYATPDATHITQILNSYARGAVSGSGSLGGLIGSSGTLNGGSASNYWDTTTSGSGTSAGGATVMGRTTAQMYQQATFTGWDFTNIWQINEGVSRPTLR